MQTWCLLGRLTQLWRGRSCSILYRCEQMWVMNKETRLKTFCGRYQKNVTPGEPIQTFFFLNFSLSPAVGAHSHEKLMRGRLRVRSSTIPALLQRPSSCSVCSAWRVINYFCCHYGGHLAEQRSVLFLCLSMCGWNSGEITRGDDTLAASQCNQMSMRWVTFSFSSHSALLGCFNWRRCGVTSN